MASPRKKRIALFPGNQRFKAKRKKLPVFKPLDVRSLIRDAGNSDGAEFALLTAFRRRNEIQMEELLRHLGLDRSHPDAWQKGFLHLAHYHHGVGHIAWYPQRTNRNAATWRMEHDFVLVQQVAMLTRKGLSERRAIKALAADRKKRQLFPYRRQQQRHHPRGAEQKQCEDALRARLHKVKASAKARLRLESSGGDPKDEFSFFEGILSDLDTCDFLSLTGEKPGAPRK